MASSVAESASFIACQRVTSPRSFAIMLCDWSIASSTLTGSVSASTISPQLSPPMPTVSAFAGRSAQADPGSGASALTAPAAAAAAAREPSGFGVVVTAGDREHGGEEERPRREEHAPAERARPRLHLLLHDGLPEVEAAHPVGARHVVAAVARDVAKLPVLGASCRHRRGLRPRRVRRLRHRAEACRQ